MVDATNLPRAYAESIGRQIVAGMLQMKKSARCGALRDRLTFPQKLLL